jgi:hypothetical protein
MDRWKLTSFGWMKSCALSVGIAAGLMTFGGAVPKAHAESPEECQQRIVHAEHDLHKAIEHHGRDSKQANHERHELQEARERCWREHHRWWDEREQRWHDQKDWDDQYRDRDRDRN